MNAKTFLEKRYAWLAGFAVVLICCLFRYNDDMELEDAIHTAILTLKEGFEGAVTSQNIEIAVVDKDRKFKVLSEAQVTDYISVSLRVSLLAFVRSRVRRPSHARVCFLLCSKSREFEAGDVAKRDICQIRLGCACQHLHQLHTSSTDSRASSNR